MDLMKMSEPVIHHLANLERNQDGVLWTMSFLGFYLESMDSATELNYRSEAAEFSAVPGFRV
uniref:Uncharacterized protein n=1 Tax=Meloidogyne incognita TaxID=6306 RepID=A0A914KN24_MELIC